MEQIFFFYRYPKLTLFSVVIFILSLAWVGAEIYIKPRIEKEHIHYDAVNSLTYKDDTDPSEAHLFPPQEIMNNGTGVHQTSNLPYQINHQFLGYSHPRSVSVRVKKSFKGKAFIDVVYNFDEHRRRITPVKDSEKRTVNALFFGCSFMMGDSLNDNQTIAYYFSEKLPQVRSYNYAIGGMGAPAMLYQIENRDLQYELGEAEKNIGIYIFADSHVERSALDAFRSTWLVDVPYYDWDGKKLVQYQSFAHAKPYIFRLYQFITDSNVLGSRLEDLTFLNHQSKWKSERQFVEIVKRAKESFEKKLKNAEFYVAFYPAVDVEESLRVENMLRRAGINIIKLEIPPEDYKIHPLESHFNEIANERLAEVIAKEVKL